MQNRSKNGRERKERGLVSVFCGQERLVANQMEKLADAASYLKFKVQTAELELSVSPKRIRKMLGVSVITLDYKQWKPPVSYYLKKKTSLKVTHSTKKGGRSNLDHSRNQETTAIRKGRKPRDDSCLLSSSSWVECHLLPHSRLSLSAPDSKSIGLAKPRPTASRWRIVHLDFHRGKGMAPDPHTVMTSLLS